MDGQWVQVGTMNNPHQTLLPLFIATVNPPLVGQSKEAKILLQYPKKNAVPINQMVVNNGSIKTNPASNPVPLVVKDG